MQVPIVEANDAAELLVPENDDLIAETEKQILLQKLRGDHIPLGCFYASLCIVVHELNQDHK